MDDNRRQFLTTSGQWVGLSVAASQVIACGGIKDITDIEQLLAVQQQGVSGAILGRSIYEGTLDLKAAAALVQQEQ